jgi:hypothetical protein
MPTLRTLIGIPSLVTMATSIVALLGAHSGRLAASPPEPDIVVTTAAELQSALSPANAGAHILVRAGVYDVSQALTVPDGADLIGEGVMILDQSGLPTGFDPIGRTLLKATAALAGDVLTLGDGATIRGLAIQDVVGRVTGGAVAVLSRAPGDFISARIEECEIITPSLVVGTTGRGLVVMTRNLDLEPPHEGAVLRVQMAGSIVRSPGAANGVFAINFASHSQITLDVESNVIGGTVNSAAGVGLPDAVTGASLIIQSSHNLYRSDSLVPTATGWQLFAGADAPIPSIVSQASTFNTLQMHSIDDTLAGFATGIVAAGGRRINALSGTISSNRVELNLHGTRLQTTTADLRLSGATTGLSVSTGDDNTAHVLLVHATGSGVRANRYAHSSIPLPGSPGIGNRLEIFGNANAFDQTNDNFVPPPPAEFFRAGIEHNRPAHMRHAPVKLDGLQRVPFAK